MHERHRRIHGRRPTKDREDQAGAHCKREAGKSVHSGESLRDSEYSLIDYNRGGVALIEIVTQPDMRSGEEARLFMERLRTLLRYIEVSDCKMQEGSLRCDANINLNIHDQGRSIRTPIVEVKNLNSFRSLERAINYEAERQYLEYLEVCGPLICRP